MKTRLRLSLVGAAVALLIGGIGIYVKTPREAPPAAGALSPVALSPLALPIAQPEVAPAPAPGLLARHGLVAPAKRKPETKAESFDRLAASREPRQRFAAYELAQYCVTAHILAEPARTPWFGVNRPALEFDKTACGDLKPGQWDDAERRIELLREASAAGVHGAWWRLHGNEGPNGLYRTIPDGAEYRAWETQAYKAALASADPYALAREAQEWLRKDPARALALTVAYRESLTRNQNGVFDPNTDREVAALAATLTPAAASKAIAVGRTYAAANRSKP